MFEYKRFITIAYFLLLAVGVQAAEVAGKVGYMSGALVAQRSNGVVQVLGMKSEVLAGDMLITAKDSYAQIQMNDGSRLTLRPNSNLHIKAYGFKAGDPKADNAVFHLLKGGFRTVTGLIGKRGNPDSYKVHAASATIGIRGTDFTSRLCATTDCKDEESETRVVNKVTSQVIGRVMLAEGELSARDASGKIRKLSLGGAVYEAEQIITGSKSVAVVAFRDESRVTLQENTVFQIEKFKYDKAASQESAVLRLVKGGVRVVTGLIGRITHENYKFQVANSTIGIRGTGFDSWCHGPCASGSENPGASEDKPLDGAGVFVWSGEVALVSICGGADCPTQIVGINQAAILSRDSGKPVQIKLIPQSILNSDTPRPDSLNIDMEKLFGSQASAGEPGLYVTVQEGHVILSQGDRMLDLGRSETGFAGEHTLIRLASPPAFMGRDMQINAQSANLSSGNPSVNSGGCAVQ